MRKVIGLLGVFISVCISTVFSQTYPLYVGTYTDGLSQGIYVGSFDSDNGEISDMRLAVQTDNPSFLAIDSKADYLYSVNQTTDFEGERSGALSSFRINEDLSLSFVNQVASKGAGPCHISLSQDNKKLVVSNYVGGNLSLFNVNSDGSVSQAFQTIQHKGYGPVSNRQDGPHAHSARFDRDGKYVFSADLGIDELRIYKWKKRKGKYRRYDQPFVKMERGAGPRHFEIISGTYVYVINELNSTISVIKKRGCMFGIVQTVSTLPDSFEGDNTCADIHISPDGNFLYGSNRGHNSIVVFKRDPDNGKLQFVEHVSVHGDWPRNFTLSPDGRFLLVANRRTNNITIFNVDRETGRLNYSGTKDGIYSPVCLLFVE